MQFKVIHTYRNGKRLSRGEINAAIPVLGELVVSDWKDGNNSAKRILRVAKLYQVAIDQVRPEVCKPLFDPVVTRMTEKYFLLKGWEIDSVNGGEVIEYAQAWLMMQP